MKILSASVLVSQTDSTRSCMLINNAVGRDLRCDATATLIVVAWRLDLYGTTILQPVRIRFRQELLV
jgi:hypothetical protein